MSNHNERVHQGALAVKSYLQNLFPGEKIEAYDFQVRQRFIIGGRLFDASEEVLFDIATPADVGRLIGGIDLQHEIEVLRPGYTLLLTTEGLETQPADQWRGQS